jgi:hypothetical protein
MALVILGTSAYGEVETRSNVIPNLFFINEEKSGTTENTPIEPVMVLGCTNILSALQAI